MNPRRIGADFSITARGYVRNGVGLFFSLFFPIILISLFGLIFSGSNTPPTLYVVNNDHDSLTSQTFLAGLNQTGAVTVDMVTANSTSSFSSYLASNGDGAGLYIPAGFGSAYSNHSRFNVSLYVNPGNAAAAGAAEGAVQGALNYLNLRAANGTPILGATTAQIGGVSYSYIDYLVPGLIGFSILTSPMFAMVEVTATYRKEGLFRQLSLTPLTRAEWLTSKILWYSVLTFASAGIMIGMGYGVFHSHVVLSWGILPFLFVGPFLFVSLGMLSGSVAKTPETAAIIGNVITFPMMFLSGTFFPVSSFPPYLQAFAHILPLYYVIDGIEGVMLYGNYARAFGDLIVVLVIAVVIFLAAVRAFRWREA
ncbi:MAG TPA: ABC transporter permease [Thermoplasmata archaeon]|nr:ABC transporter permease [Thermoplasmata archaeon]